MYLFNLKYTNYIVHTFGINVSSLILLYSVVSLTVIDKIVDSKITEYDVEEAAQSSSDAVQWVRVRY